MEMIRIIWVSRVSSVPVLGERIEGRQHCKVVYFVYACVHVEQCNIRYQALASLTLTKMQPETTGALE